MNDEGVNRRNIQALDQAAKQDRARVDDLETRLRLLAAQYAATVLELTTLRQQVALFLAGRGRGATT